MNVEGGSRQSQIVRVAAMLFEKRGYEGTTMEEIAETVGLRKPSLYHYFRSKEDILVSIHKNLADVLIRKLRQRIAAGVRPWDNLHNTIFDIVNATETQPGHLRVFFATHRVLSSTQLEIAQGLRDEYLTMVEQVISDGIADGSFRPGNPSLIALVLSAICNAAEFRTLPPFGWSALLDQEASDPAEIADTLWEILTVGVAAK